MLQVTRQLRMDGWPALSIHGDKTQQERDWVLAEFKQNKSPIMLATDVAARGLGRIASMYALCCCSPCPVLLLLPGVTLVSPFRPLAGIHETCITSP